VITGRRSKPLAETVAELGSGVRAVPFDAADPQQVQQAFAELAAAWQANLQSNLLSAVLVTASRRGTSPSPGMWARTGSPRM
jgi:NAD(P)-dependent dehydrogenase (short-subunit alcohol dehydrogenase family)